MGFRTGVRFSSSPPKTKGGVCRLLSLVLRRDARNACQLRSGCAPSEARLSSDSPHQRRKPPFVFGAEEGREKCLPTAKRLCAERSEAEFRFSHLHHRKKHRRGCFFYGGAIMKTWNVDRSTMNTAHSGAFCVIKTDWVQKMTEKTKINIFSVLYAIIVS